MYSIYEVEIQKGVFYFALTQSGQYFFMDVKDLKFKKLSVGNPLTYCTVQHAQSNKVDASKIEVDQSFIDNEKVKNYLV